MPLTLNEARARARRGAAYLDERCSGWRDRIDTATLDTNDWCRCPLGQLFGSYGIAATEFGMRDDALAALGFFAGEHDDDYGRLDIAWREILAGREAQP